jgi:hypothetical protein
MSSHFGLPVTLNPALRHPLRWHRLRVEARRSTAYLASYPKSGRTWFRFILANYFADTLDLPIELDLRTVFQIVPNYDLDPKRGLPAVVDRSDLPLVLVSHLPYSALLFPPRPIIFMVRNASDLMVSSYFHSTRHKRVYSGSIGEFVRDPTHGLARYIRYLNGWARGLRGRPHLVFSYEQLSTRPQAMTARVLEFLRLPIDEAAVARAVENSRFDVMKELEVSRGIHGHSYDRSDDESLRVRRGEVGGASRYLDRSEIAWIEETLLRDLSPAARQLQGVSTVHMTACKEA